MHSLEGCWESRESLPVWGEWIEIPDYGDIVHLYGSLPVWGEWIEMPIATARIAAGLVSPRVGRVD